MATIESNALDIIEELRLRTWARENYVSSDRRDPSWHEVVLQEMESKDQESGVSVLRGSSATEDQEAPRSLRA